MKGLFTIFLLAAISCTPVKVERHLASTRGCFELLRELQKYRTSSRGFNERFLNFVPSSRASRAVGIENEFIVPMDLGRKGVADFLEEEIKKAYPNVEITRARHRIIFPEYDEIFEDKYHEISIRYVVNGKKKVWKITPEPIQDVPGTYQICEIASPVMETKAERDFYKGLMTKLKRDKGAFAFPKRGGVHYHYDVSDLQENELRLMYFTYYKLEEDLIDFFGRSPGRQAVYGLSHNSTYFEKAFADSSFSFLGDENLLQNKFFFLRYVPENPTFEFRLLNSTMSSQVIEGGYQLHSKLIDAIRSQNPEFLDYLAECFTNRKKAKLEDVASILGLDFVFSASFKQQLAVADPF